MTAAPSRRRRPLILVGAVALLTAIAVAATALGIAPWAPGAPGNDVPVPHFVEATATSGVTYTSGGDFTYAVGGGVAVFDCNDDGRPDMYLAGGESPAALFRNDSEVGGALRFTRIPGAATDLAAVNGAYPIDVDGDGRIDLAVLRNGENVLLRGLGDCRFERANERWGFDGGNVLTEAFSAMWERGATLPTLAFGNYVDPGQVDPSKWCQPNVLVRPNADGAGGGFGAPVQLNPSFCALSMLFSAWDGSGRMDLRVSNDQHYYPPTLGEEQLWRIEPGAAPRLYTRDDGWQAVRIQGMGIASQDLTGDGLPEIYLTSQAASRLQTLANGASQPDYTDIGGARNANVAQPFAGGEHLPSTAWHPEFEDVNNDGRFDLFVSKGNVTTQPDYAQKDPSNLLLGLPDGTFREVADVAGILSFDRGRGAALADFNLDGWLDLVEVNYGAPVRIWRNTGTPIGADAPSVANWLEIRVRDAAPNVDAIGG
ncbi:MAG TPA: FG-GAP-like repeat-containing protein, partial [Candidatus Limnocylindrales bacterium]|nr:FG-GAP-like repeat-containing protein [Candidatus Limnocylindrales bacterium]